jgi:hypothetical protein
MRKNVILGIVLIAFAVLVGWFSFFLPEREEAGTTVPIPPGDATGGGQVFEIPVTEWKEYWTPPVSDAEIPTGNPLDHIDIGGLGAPLDDRGTREIFQNDSFVITYYGTDSSVFVTLNREPIAQSRIEAEQSFLRTFGLKKAEACRLNVVLNVTGSVAPYAAGQDYGLSFCPDGRPLPES